MTYTSEEIKRIFLENPMEILNILLTIVEIQEMIIHPKSVGGDENGNFEIKPDKKWKELHSGKYNYVGNMLPHCKSWLHAVDFFRYYILGKSCNTGEELSLFFEDYNFKENSTLPKNVLEEDKLIDFEFNRLFEEACK